MKFAFVLALTALAIVHSLPTVVQLHENERLIQFNSSFSKWMTEPEILSLIRKETDCSGWMDITDHPHLAPEKGQPNPRIPSIPVHEEVVNSFISKISMDRFVSTLNGLSSYKTRYYQTSTGEEAALWLQQQYLNSTGDRSDITVELYKHSFRQPSVVVRVPGSGPRKDETVIVGGHLDSINVANPTTGVAPGVDDDASGSSTVLETFRVLMAGGFVPDRSVEFHAYAAEEVGLRGSQDIAAEYQKEGIKVASMAQFDMTLYSPEGNAQMAIVTDNVDDELTAFMGKLMDTYCSVPYTTTRCGYGCSDHASWNKAGYASTFPFETEFARINPKIHTPNDTLEYAPNAIAHAEEYVKLAIGYVVEMASGEK
jgi:leucyl aminopeptidase